ncbi:MAG TPA: peptidylprolyl isomerase [Bryobacteraceae bacterium]|nr:peptidylprolyl isomerase [Bryobacteraceae bacterium]
MKALIVLLATGAAIFAQTPHAKSAAPSSAGRAPAANPLLHPETLKGTAPAIFEAKFTTTKGDFVVTVHRDWSPNGADRFYNLVKYHYFNDASFFRIVPGFIAQFGMAADPKINAIWEKANIKDDPSKPTVHNTRGTLVFAATGAPNSRTTQLFINLNDNSRSLDSQGFTPFGEVTQGMDVVMNLYSGYGEGADMGGRGPTQQMISSHGKPYLDKNFPKLDSIKNAVIVPSTAAPAAKSTPATPVKK